MAWESGAVYESDLPAHISLAVDDGLIYSLISLIIIGLDKIGLLNLLPVVLGIFAGLSVFFAGTLLDEVTEHKWNKAVTLFIGLMLNIFMPCYVKGLSSGRYMGMHSSSIWHNSTYLMMKWMGLWVILIYLLIEKNISEKLSVRSYVYFVILLTLTTAAKPNFFLAVTPVMLIFLIMDMVSKRAPLGRLIVFASAVIPSFAVMLFQNSALFTANEGNNGIVIAPGRAMSVHTGYLIPVSILSIAFPLMVLLLHIKELFKNRYMLFAWLCAIVGYMEYFLFSEEGNRNMDANFSWGYAFTIILIFGISLVQWLGDVRKTFIDKPDKGTKDIALKAYIMCCGAVLLYHTYCGVLYFIRIVSGVSYMMWG